ncbi:MAG TPA: UDP-N-acetylmuramate--L-alanine ligase [Patescibacteria group bacterium]|nr:UDP-N-acetylmuramate--L-alanine ligase [Patescibacteria group bacterium]
MYEKNNIFIIGIKGVAMANFALILKKMGKKVSGVDVKGLFITDELIEKNKIPWSIGFDPQLLPHDTDTAIYAASHGGKSNSIVQEAQKRNIPIMTQPEALEEIFSLFKTKIAICGTHGKTTTSSLLSYLLIQLQQSPSYLVGAPQFGKYWGADYHTSDYFVLEADEYGVNPPLDKTPKFLSLNPDYIVATTIDFDHPDVYKDIASVKKAFLQFFKKKSVKKIIACCDDVNLTDVLNDIPKNRIATYGFSPESDLIIYDMKTRTKNDICSQSISLSYKRQDIGDFTSLLFGEKNALNTAGTILFLLELGCDSEKIKKSLVHFSGAQRRFELVQYVGDIVLFDDYAHHPEEIDATINAFRTRFPNHRLMIIFQPHTYSRTRVFKSEFAESLSRADCAIVTDIYPSARENQDQILISSEAIVIEAHSHGKKNVIYQSKKDLLHFLEKNIRQGDIICTMGAGDIYTLKNDIIEIMNSRNYSDLERMIGKDKVKHHIKLAPYSTLKMGGIAEYYIDALTREDIITCVKACHALHMPLTFLGGASNVVITEKNIRGVVMRNLYREKKILTEDSSETSMTISSGYPLSLLVRETVDAGLSGLEYHLGLPGTMGGALYMNSKWTHPDSYVGDQLIGAELITTEGVVKKVDRDYFQFGYDTSILQKTKEIVLTATFKFIQFEKEKLMDRMNTAFEYRKKTQPIGVSTAGCFFKNINGQSVGKMIGALGLKGYAIGGFSVSPHHANFIIHKGNGTYEDLHKLVSVIKQKVHDTYGVLLEEEVVYIQ